MSDTKYKEAFDELTNWQRHLAYLRQAEKSTRNAIIETQGFIEKANRKLRALEESNPNEVNING